MHQELLNYLKEINPEEQSVAHSREPFLSRYTKGKATNLIDSDIMIAPAE